MVSPLPGVRTPNLPSVPLPLSVITQNASVTGQTTVDEMATTLASVGALADLISTLLQMTGAVVAKASLAELVAVAGSYVNGNIGLVLLDVDATKRGIYKLQAGAWVKIDDLPADVARAAVDAAQAFRDDAEIQKIAAQAARDIAAGYASDAVSQGNVPIYSTIDGMPGESVKAGIISVHMNGKSAVGDGQEGLFIRINADPGATVGDSDKFRSEDRFLPDGSTDATNGGWWLRKPSLYAEAKSNIWIPGREFSLPAGYGPGTAAAFNSALQAVALRGGGEVIVPADGPIILDDTIDNKYAGALLRSSHIKRNFSNGGADPFTQGARFVASSSLAGGIMCRVRTPKASEMGGVKQRINTGGGFEGVTWLGNGYAAQGVEVTSVWYAILKGCVTGISTDQGGNFAVLFDCGVQGTDYQDTGSTQHCDIDLSIRLIDNAYEYGVTAVGLTPSSNANFSMNKSVRLDVAHKNGSAFFAQGMDNNNVILRAFRVSGGTGHGLLINGPGLVAGDTVGCDANYFDVSCTGPISATGTETAGITAGVKNILYRDEANGTPAPTAGTGSYWRDITCHGRESGGVFNKHAVGDNYNSALQALDFLRANPGYTEALVNGSNAHQALISAAGVWRVFVDAATGDYVLGRVSGTGVLDIGGNVRFSSKIVSLGDADSAGTGFKALRVPN